MKEKNKKILNLEIIGGLIICLVVVLIIVYLEKPKMEGNNTETPNTPTDNQSSTDTENIDKVLEDYDYYCKMTEVAEETITTYYENIKVNGDRVLKTQSSMLVDFSSEDSYNKAKENPEYKNGKFDDEARNVHYTIGGTIDFTKSETGGESFTYYEDLKKSFEDLGYLCKPYDRNIREE